MAGTRQVSAESNRKNPFRYQTAAILLLILVLAAFLRLFNLGQSPPGLNQDEAANAWNAHCLLKTGKDQVGASWPIFYMRALGGNRSTVHVYLLLPFQAIGGMNISTTRVPAAIGGVLTVLLIYFVGRRLFGRTTGLTAAALLALNPWHIQQSRWGHGADLCALFAIIPLAMMLWANMPLSDEGFPKRKEMRLGAPDKARSPRPVLAALAGAAAGLCCYSYPAMRLFVPVFLLAVIMVTLPAWPNQLKTRRGALAIGAFAFGFAITFIPLAWEHIFHFEGVARYRQALFLWDAADPLYVALYKIAARYIQHFGPDFLFINGDHYPIQSPPDIGQFHWYMLPLMLIGLFVLVRRFKCSLAARVLLAFILVYPVGDSFFRHISLHSLRSLPGLCSLVLLAALGATVAGRWLWKKNRRLTFITTAVFALVVVGLNTRYLHRFYGEFNRRPEIYHSFHVDLIEACRWLRGRLGDVDAVFCTTEGMNQPYIITLVALEYEPARWFREGRDFITPGNYDFYTRYGKMHFMYGSSFVPALTELQQSAEDKNVIFIVRPGERGLKNPIHRIYRPDGREVLWICRL